MIGAVNAFSEKCVRGLQANRVKAEGWLEQNAILVTALNPLIGYSAGAQLVKEALNCKRTIRQLALAKAQRGELKRQSDGSPVTPEEIERALGDLRRLTEGGIWAG